MAWKPGAADFWALCFLAALVVLPTVVIVIGFGEGGGIFVIGYLLGAMTGPALFLGSIRAVGTLIGPTSFNNVTVLVFFTLFTTLVSGVIALWSVRHFLQS